jgi:hypothetical protein
MVSFLSKESSDRLRDHWSPVSTTAHDFTKSALQVSITDPAAAGVNVEVAGEDDWLLAIDGRRGAADESFGEPVQWVGQRCLESFPG